MKAALQSKLLDHGGKVDELRCATPIRNTRTTEILLIELTHCFVNIIQ